MNHDYGYFEDDHLGQVSDLRLWRRIARFIRPQWRWVLLSVLLASIITVTSLALPRIVQLALDGFIVNADLDTAERLAGISRLAGAFLLAIVIGFVANFFQVLALEWAGQNAMHDMRQSLFSHVIELDLRFFHTRPVGRLVTRLTNDIQNMHEMFTSVIVTLFNDGIRLIGILAIMFWMNWRLALILSTTFPVMLVITLWFGRLSRDAFREIRSRLAGINAYIQESVTGIAIIQLFLREKDSLARFRRLNQDYFKATFTQIRIFGVFMPLIDVMSSLALALIIWYGGGQVVRDHMTIGILTAFIAYMRLFFQPLRELSQKYSIVQSAMASAERIFQMLETPGTLTWPQEASSPTEVRGDIVFDDVTFEYEPGRPVLRHLCFEVRPGETLAIVGATGSGKTSIINLLERFYDPLEGYIRLDGRDLRELDLHWIRDQVGLVMQDVLIIPGTVRENILLDRDPGDAKLDEIVRLSQLSEVVKGLPEGLETRIGEGAMDLSAGQKQLLAFARVLARNPRILVLDEATANVDTETEMLIEQA
ncbi:MAG: ABC transporter ATP-binding protein/permease, partial [Syntrophobacteraceae bacterium]|nr:ABC transporter ATP-binding protein/permease [Syntrophobacteraceae bacterium]